MATLSYVQGDLFASLKQHQDNLDTDGIPNPPHVVVPHVCNNQGAWGAGFVLELSKFCEGAENSYRVPTRSGLTLGRVHDHQEDSFTIMNMVAQVLGGPKPLRYAALGCCLYEVINVAELNEFRTGVDVDPEDQFDYEPFQIWCPKFGSGLAGGSWGVIEEMIQETWVEQFQIDVTVFVRR